jgi:hypothetical protein
VPISDWRKNIVNQKLMLGAETEPVNRFDWYLLVDKFTTSLKNKVASLRPSTLTGPQSTNQLSFAIRN